MRRARMCWGAGIRICGCLRASKCGIDVVLGEAHVFEDKVVAAFWAVDAWVVVLVVDAESEEGVAAGTALDSGELFADTAVEPAVAGHETEYRWEPDESGDSDDHHGIKESIRCVPAVLVLEAEMEDACGPENEHPHNECDRDCQQDK